MRLTTARLQDFGWAVLWLAAWLILAGTDAVRPLLERARIVGPAE